MTEVTTSEVQMEEVVELVDVPSEATSEVTPEASPEESAESLMDVGDVSEPVAEEEPAAETSAEPSALSEMFSDDALKTDASLQTFKDVDALAKSYIHLNKLVSKKISDMSPEDAAELHSIVGVPAEPSEYTLPDDIDQIAGASFQELAHSLKLTKEQARQAVEWEYAREVQAMEEFKAKQAELNKQYVDTVKSEFGAAFNERLSAAQETVRAYGGDELKQVLKDHGLGNHPTVIKAFAAIGKDLVEDRLVEGDAKRTFGVTPHDAENQIKTLMNNPEFMAKYNSSKTSERTKAINELQELYKLKNAT